MPGSPRALGHAHWVDQLGSPSRKPTTIGTLIAGISVLALVCVTFVGLSYVQPMIRGRSQLEAIALFVPALVLICSALFDEARRRPYSLHLFHLGTIYVLFVAAPMYQVAFGRFPLERFAGVRPPEILQVNLIVLLWCLFYCIAYFVAHWWFTQRRPGLLRRFLTGPVSKARILSGLLISLPVFVVLIALGVGGVVTRGGAGEALSEVSTSPRALIVRHCLRSFPIIALAATLLMFQRVRFWRYPGMSVLAVAVAVGILYASNPLAAARYWTVAVVVGVFAPQVLRRSNGSVVVLAMVLGLVILPALNATRRAQTADEAVAELSLQGIPEPTTYLATSMDFGSYSILKLSTHWTEKNDHTYGRQLLGVLLFWVPRAFWHDKPLATGTMVSEGLGFDFATVSAPIMADPFVDFGWMGVPILACLVGLVFGFFDTTYFSRDGRDSPSGVRKIDTIYPFFVGMVPMLTRGSLLTSFGFMVAFVIAASPLCLGSSQRKTARNG